jgi:hypothetical protein
VPARRALGDRRGRRAPDGEAPGTPWAPPTGTTLIEAGPTPLGDAPQSSDPESEAYDELAALSARVPEEALLAPPAECVLAARAEEQRRRRMRRAVLVAVLVAANALLWWAIASWM